MLPSVRELLSHYLLAQQDVVRRELASRIAASPDLALLHDAARVRQWQPIIETLLPLMMRNIADPRDRRCFDFARQSLQERRKEAIAPTHLLRVTALLRGVLGDSIATRFGNETPFLQRMNGLLDEQFHELEETFAQSRDADDKGAPASGEARGDNDSSARAWHNSETRYFSLFENASEAIISFRPPEGEIVEVNAQAERLLGQPRAALLGTLFIDLFPDEHREQIRWLIQQSHGTSVRLEDMTVRRAPQARRDRRNPIASPTQNKGRRATDSHSTPAQAAQSTADAGMKSRWLEVPVSLSCNWIVVEGQAIAQAILRDVTQLRQMQRELQSYATQLEERVASRTRELQLSEERYRALFLQEQRRAQHLSLINEVQQCALEASEGEKFLSGATRAIQGHFRNCDVSFLLLEGADHFGGALGASSLPAPSSAWGERDLIVVASAGGHGLSLPIGGRHPAGLGLSGQVAARGETLRYSPAAADGEAAPQPHPPEEWTARPAGIYRDALSAMAVPVTFEGQILGVVSVQSEEVVAFDARDAVALQTATTIIASHLHSSRMFREMGELNQFHQALINTMSHSLLMVDRAGRVQVVNDRLCQTLRLNRDALLGQPMAHVFGEGVVEKHGLQAAISAVAEDGAPREVPEVQVWMTEGNAVFDLRIFRVYFRGEAHVVVLMINITLRWRKAHQLQMMHEIGRFFQASLDINKVLYTVLTCITAGSALGFNRGFVLLRPAENQRGELQRRAEENEKTETDALKGAMALGPSSAEEAGRIWNELGQSNPSLQDILAAFGEGETKERTVLQQSTLALALDLNNPSLRVLRNVVHEMRATCVPLDDLFGSREGLSPLHLAQVQAARALFTAPCVAIAPLVAKDHVVGLVLADNLYSGAPIDEDDIQLLDTLAQQAGLTIDNALTYQALQRAQRELVSAERLAAVGEMAARVSHEIRNPLATIGGFARSILKRPDNRGGVERKTGIIVEEVSRLEELLTDLLDMARPRELTLEAHDLNDVVAHALLLADADISGTGIEVQTHFATDLPPILLDRRRLLQAVLNIIRNGAQSMPEGGTLEISTNRHPHPANVAGENDGDGSAPELNSQADSEWVTIAISDQGVGISAAAAKQIFDPFFSTKVSGSGLGLAVTRRIIQDHGGDIDVHSAPGEGTTFALRLPLLQAQCELPSGD